MSSGDTLLCWGWDPETGHKNTHNITSNTWSCAEHFWTCECPPLKADPDIAGRGVTASLFASAIITALVSLCCILSASVHPREWIVNRIDARVRPWLGGLVGKKLDEQNAIRIAKVCYDLALCLGDQQLVTSIALLIAAIKKLQIDGTLSVYHFTYVMNIATLSSTAHTYTTITYWSMKYMDEPKDDSAFDTEDPKPFLTWKRLRNGLPWTLRILLMCTLDGLLLYSSWAAAREDWDVTQRCPALCVMKNSPVGGEGKKWMIMTYVFLFSSDIAGIVENISSFRVGCWCVLYMRPKLIDDRGLPANLRSREQRTEQAALVTRVWRWCRMTVVKRSPTVLGISHRNVDQMDAAPLTVLKDDRPSSVPVQRHSTNQQNPDGQPCSATVGFTERWILRPVKAVLSRLWLLKNSKFWQLLETTAWFGAFFKWAVECRVLGQSEMDEEEFKAEQAMGFGQIVPVFLLVLFVLQVFDSLEEHYKDNEDRAGAMTPGEFRSTSAMTSDTSLESHMSMNSLAPSIGPRVRGTW